MAHEIQYITVKAVIFDDDRVLLLQDQKGQWELPGGKINFGEAPEDALTRELFEELGLAEPKIDAITSAWSFVATSALRSAQYVVLVYLCRTPSAEFSLSDEHKTAGWMSAVEINTLNMRQGYKRAIQLARKQILAR